MEASLTTDVAVSRQTGKLEMVCEAVSPRPLQLLDPSSSAGVWLAGRDPPLLCKELFMLGGGASLCSWLTPLQAWSLGLGLILCPLAGGPEDTEHLARPASPSASMGVSLPFLKVDLRVQ